MSEIATLKGGVAVFDVDGTINKSSCLEKVVKAACRRGLFDSDNFQRADERRAQWQNQNNEGIYTSYIKALVGGFVASIVGVKESDFAEVVESMVQEEGNRMFAFPRQLAEQLRDTHSLFAVSGSPLPVITPFLEPLGFDQIIGSTFAVVDGVYTEEIHAVQKETVLDELGLSVVSVGIGDTVGDLAVLQRSICPIAFNPSATLRRHAEESRWAIVTETKDAIYQMLPGEENYSVHFERNPALVLGHFGVVGAAA